ncbi:MAG TPA: hypothetical protein GX401_03280 [Clostridiales bacterium]|nr:hypothetical protein [Clostridiales bacterium]
MLGWIVAVIIFTAWMVTMYRAGKAIKRQEAAIIKLLNKYNIPFDD